MPGSGPPNAITLWVVISNVAFAVPLALALRAREWLRATGLLALLVISAVYHYAHDTELQDGSAREAWYNGFREYDTWELSKVDTVLSVWVAAASALRFVPSAPRTAADAWVDRGILSLVLFGALAVITWGGYNKCAKGIQSCSSDYLGLWYLCVVGGAMALAALWALHRRKNPSLQWNAHRKAWGPVRLALYVWAVVGLLTVAALLYAQWTERALHGVWHVCCAALISLALLWD